MASKHRLPTPALCVSRFRLDAALGGRFRELGGALREGERWRDLNFGEGVVCAKGRHPQPLDEGWRWFGLKIHARNVTLDADLEMHLSNQSYVGLCRLSGGEVNVCGLFRRRPNQSAGGGSLNWLRSEPGSPLFARLEHADFDGESFCAVAGLSLRPQPIEESECRIGDALTMIPPITGNGMSMAFESAQIALKPLLAFARGEASWEKTTRRVALDLRQTFAPRLRWAGLLHKLMFSRTGSLAVPFLLRAAPGWRAAFALTR